MLRPGMYRDGTAGLQVLLRRVWLEARNHVSVAKTHHHYCPSTSRMSMSNRALPMSGTADGDAVSHWQVLRRAGSVHHRADN